MNNHDQIDPLSGYNYNAKRTLSSDDTYDPVTSLQDINIIEPGIITPPILRTINTSNIITDSDDSVEQHALTCVNAYWNHPGCDLTTTPKRMADTIISVVSRRVHNEGAHPDQSMTSPLLEVALMQLWWGKGTSPLGFHPEIDHLIFNKKVHTCAVMMALFLLHISNGASCASVEDSISKLIDCWNKDGRKSTKMLPLFCHFPGAKKDTWVNWVKKSYRHLLQYNDSLVDIYPNFVEGGFVSKERNPTDVWSLMRVGGEITPLDNFIGEVNGGNMKQTPCKCSLRGGADETVLRRKIEELVENREKVAERQRGMLDELGRQLKNARVQVTELNKRLDKKRSMRSANPLGNMFNDKGFK